MPQALPPRCCLLGHVLRIDHGCFAKRSELLFSMRDKHRLLDGRAGLARATGVHEPPQRDRIEKHGERHAR